VVFFQGKSKTYESSLVEQSEPNGKDKKTAIFQLDIPLASLKPGFYLCQLSVIDDAAGHFLFPRFALVIRPEKTEPHAE
jgi:hypothetical protein